MTKINRGVILGGLVIFFCLFSSLSFAQTFSDVPSDYWAYSQIEGAKKANLIAGYPDGTYHPEEQVTRAQMAVFLQRALNLPLYTGPQIFTDVPTGYWAFGQIGAVYKAGIAAGFTPTTYVPEGIVTRAQMAVFLTRAVKLDTSIYNPANSSTWAANFTDVPTTYWSWKEIQAVVGAKIAAGFSPTTYAPDSPLTRAQMAVFLCRAFDIRVFDPAKLASTVTSSSEYGTYYDDKTLDNNLTTYWQGRTGASPWWLKYDLGSIYNLSYITIYWNKDRGATNYDLQISNDNLSWTTVYSALSTPASTTNPLKVTLELTGKTGRYVRIYIKTAKSSYPIIYETYIYGYKINDATLPTITISSPINNAYVSKTTPIQVNATDNVAVMKVEFSIDNALVFTDQKAPYTYSWDTTKYLDGSHAIKATAWDTSYNRKDASISVKVDNTVPAGTIKINNDSQYTKSTTVTLNLSATDSGSGMGTGAQMQFSNDSTTWSIAEAYATTKAWTLASGDGTKTVYAKFKDVAGNWSTTISDTIILDTIAPAAPTINPVVSPTQIDSQTISGTKSTDATTITVTCATATIGTVTYPTTTSWSCTLTNLSVGTNNITIQAKDAAGNTSASVTTSIIYNRAPQVGTITPSSGTSNPNQAVSFTTTYSDPDGWQDLQDALFLINTAIDGRNCFFGYYQQSSNKLYLRDDASTTWMGGFSPGSANIIENSYVKLNCATTSASGSGNTLTINWSITFKSNFTGTKNTYLDIGDKAGVYTGFAQKGTWTITQILSISVNPKLWTVGSTGVNKVVTMAETNKITITNDGTGPETLELKLIDPVGWTSSTSPSQEIYVLSGLFCSTADVPQASHFNQDASNEDVITSVSKKATNTVFGYTQSTANGVAVSSGSVRALYLQFKSPTITSKNTEQNIDVIVSCQVP